MKLTRKLITGREVPVANDAVKLIFATRCPKKWMLINIETGDVLSPDLSGKFSPATDVERSEAKAALQ